VIQNVSLDAFKRDKMLKAIRTDYREHQNQRTLVEALDEFLLRMSCIGMSSYPNPH
jgi:hypothetical protein